jgi:SAM-dependent methyltransferase
VPDASHFYTGLVADLYGPLRGNVADEDIYARFIEKHGEPALELGCGDGDPILELRRRGFDVDGIDASPDMIERCRARAAAMGVAVDVSVQLIEELHLARRYRSIYLAGPTFNLLPDDATASRALERIGAHLADGGTALVPLFIPDALPDASLGQWKTAVDDQGRTIRFANIAQHRDEVARNHTTRLRYERVAGEDVESVERDFTIHWYTQDQFRGLAESAGLTVVRVIEFAPVAFAFRLTAA